MSTSAGATPAIPNARRGRGADRGARQLRRVGRRLVREVLAEPGDAHRPVRGVAARVARCVTHERGAARARHHDLEQVQRRRRSSATPSTSSTVIGLPKNTASGLAHALTRWSAAILARATLVPAVAVVVALRVHRVAAVLRDVAVGQLELGLRRAPRAARRAVHRAGRRGCARDGRRRRRRRRRRAHDHVAQTRARSPPRPATPCRPPTRRRGRPARRSSPTSRSTRRRWPARSIDALGHVARAHEAVDLAATAMPASASASAASSAHCSRLSAACR